MTTPETKDVPNGMAEYNAETVALAAARNIISMST